MRGRLFLRGEGFFLQRKNCALMRGSPALQRGSFFLVRKKFVLRRRNLSFRRKTFADMRENGYGATSTGITGAVGGRNPDARRQPVTEEKERIIRHPAFAQAMRLEPEQYLDVLEFRDAYNLATEPRYL
jgi:hypothetical protein